MRNTPLKFVLPAILAAAATPALASDGTATIQSNAAMEQWHAEISNDLERHLYFAQHRPGFQPVDGIAKLRFTLDERGRAANVSLEHSTGHRMTDRLALKAVRLLRNLDQAPVADVHNHTFVAHVVFAKSEEQRRKLAHDFAHAQREDGSYNVEAVTYVALTP